MHHVEEAAKPHAEDLIPVLAAEAGKAPSRVMPALQTTP